MRDRLKELVFGTARGLSASMEQRAQVEELVSALEAKNPNAVVTDVGGEASLARGGSGGGEGRWWWAMWTQRGGAGSEQQGPSPEALSHPGPPCAGSERAAGPLEAHLHDQPADPGGAGCGAAHSPGQDRGEGHWNRSRPPRVGARLELLPPPGPLVPMQLAPWCSSPAP